MLGSGRPFLLEIQNPRVLSSELSVKEMEEKVNTLGGELIKVKNLKVVDDQVWTLMREGEAEKQKQYAALVWTSRELEDKDLQMISSRKDMKILQNTPVRVLHRRSPLEREKIIHWMTIEKITGSTQYFLLHLCTQVAFWLPLSFLHFG
uniref:tRNA pseudouridine(55) synthase n=1 Tax=Opuntia streptacantha TaxID=393608 RepID=A0A7C9A7U9_OPUST